MSIKSKPPGYFSINLLYLMNYYQWGCIITRASPESLMGKGSNSLTVTTNGLARVRPMGGLIPLLKIIDPMAEREIGSDKAGASCWVRDPAGGDQRRQSRFISCRSAMRCFESSRGVARAVMHPGALLHGRLARRLKAAAP